MLSLLSFTIISKVLYFSNCILSASIFLFKSSDNYLLRVSISSYEALVLIFLWASAICSLNSLMFNDFMSLSNFFRISSISCILALSSLILLSSLELIDGALIIWVMACLLSPADSNAIICFKFWISSSNCSQSTLLWSNFSKLANLS